MRLTFLFLFLSIAGFSQSLTPEVVGSSGDNFSASATELSWTLGEISIETYNGSSNQITQGFHQPENGIVSVDELVGNFTFNAYPNPFNSNVFIQTDSKQFNLTIFDVVGNQIIHQSFVSSDFISMDLSDLSPGIYLFQFSQESEVVQTIKVQKL